MSLKVSRLLHAGYLFETNTTRIIFDPIFENPFSRNCYAFPNVEFDLNQIKKQKFHAVFISHFHDDHCSLESLCFIDRETPIYLYCHFDELFEVIRQLGFKHVFSLTLDQVIQIKDFEVFPRRALDYDIDCLFQIKSEGFNILNVVDSWIDWETLNFLKSQNPWDLILWPFQTLRELEVLSPIRHPATNPEIPKEWIEQLIQLSPKAIIPSSCQFKQEPWSWYNSTLFPISYQFFQRQISNYLPSAQFFRLNPGCQLVFESHMINFSGQLSWVKPIGDQNSDYSYDPQLNVPSVADTAPFFKPLNHIEKNRVHEFLRSEIIDIFKTLDVDENGYFSQKRFWELRTFDSQGVEKKYRYIVKNNSLKPAEESAEPVEWLTEIAESKIYTALNDGESLTSLYVRVNNIFFDPKTESELIETDATSDPLIMCLFNKNPISYQKAQLQRLLSKQS